MEAKEKFSVLITDIKEYINLRASLFSLSFTEKAAQILASIIANGIVVLFASLFLLFGSFAAAFVLGEWLDSYAVGFLIITGFYLLLALIALAIRKKGVEEPLTNTFIQQFLKNTDDDEQKQQ